MDVPPTYSAQPSRGDEAAVEPPSYELPYPLLVGRRAVQTSFVSISQLKGHLSLLKHFASLKERVEGMDRSRYGDAPEDKERRWSWFERWCKELTVYDALDFADHRLPPVDVIMVWHAYLLNPAYVAQRFFCDVMLIRTCYTIGSPPSNARAQDWLQKTHLPYDPFESAMVLTQREIVCPQCLTKTNVRLANSTGSGYLQQDFKGNCSGCWLTITKEKLAFHKLVKDLVGTNAVLAGTLHTSYNIDNSHRAKVIKTGILELRPRVFQKGDAKTEQEWAVNIQKHMDYSMQKIQTAMAQRMRTYGGHLLSRIMSSYEDDKIFSLDLVGAVLRQGSFVDKMHKLGWTDPEFFSSSEDEVALKHCMARYHAFLDLMSSSPAGFFVPTLDIDLVWHTHQLMARQYSSDCLEYVCRFVDHDDKVAENRLSRAFDITCRAWQDRFGIPYTHCGCPLPGDTIGQKISRLVSIHKQSGTPSHLVPPRDRRDLLAATHPSDHNAVYSFQHQGQVDAMRRARLEKRERRIRREEGKGISRNRSVGHDPAFLVPVPLYYGVGCVATTGHVVGGGGGVGGCVAAVGRFSIMILFCLGLTFLFRRALVVVEVVVSLNVGEC
ncbi:uncharacterized protein EV420DRAFT_1279692 [Desarmillaria tabescens]|uniref:Uncharacterized protein n=1 Tax=Armillaria tabescens TaxID=1929756 RepID=A0AA39JAW1_ARMTA|nr:uncharacterized protein EV420DRAFT_1279692 [Desarmillaria tabescens]KAK0439253.1 hypothetical protein EV420DRAFT_1279692 [Desarmillaria tabescens]